MVDKLTIQELVDNTQIGETLFLDKDTEIQGPVVIKKGIIIHGNNATIWNRYGSVLSIDTKDVKLIDLNLEITEPFSNKYSNSYALNIFNNQAVFFENVAVRGKVKGIKEEEGEWQYPSVLDLKVLEPKIAHTFKIIVSLPIKCQLISELSGFTPVKVTKNSDLTEIYFRLEPITAKTLIRSHLLLKSNNITRRIVIVGNVDNNNLSVINKETLLYEAKKKSLPKSLTVNKVKQTISSFTPPSKLKQQNLSKNNAFTPDKKEKKENTTEKSNKSDNIFTPKQKIKATELTHNKIKNTNNFWSSIPSPKYGSIEELKQESGNLG